MDRHLFPLYPLVMRHFKHRFRSISSRPGWALVLVEV